GPHTGVRLEKPLDAAARGAERVDAAPWAADEHAAADDCRLCVRLEIAGKAEGPLQFQLRHIGGVEASGARVGEARVGRVGAAHVALIARTLHEGVAVHWILRGSLSCERACREYQEDPVHAREVSIKLRVERHLHPRYAPERAGAARWSQPDDECGVHPFS